MTSKNRGKSRGEREDAHEADSTAVDFSESGESEIRYRGVKPISEPRNWDTITR